VVLWHSGRRELPLASKSALASDLVALITQVYAQRDSGCAADKSPAHDTARA
jgi:hypothetical protein